VSYLRNHLKPHRRNAGLSQLALSGRAGISRQAYASLESGKSSPSTEVALRLARSLETTVEDLFSLAEERPGVVQADLVEAADPEQRSGLSPWPRRTRLARVGSRLLARPLTGPAAARHSLVDAEGVIVSASRGGKRVSVQPFDEEEAETPALVLLGCDPAAALLEPGLRRYGVKLVWAEEGSSQALAGLARGEAHVAGCHLKDEATGLYNVSWVRRLVPFACTLVTFAAWRQGLIVATGNPKGIQGVEDLSAPSVTIVNREAGSGSRSLLDRLLQRLGIPPGTLAGYDREAGGHLAVARAVSSGNADAGVGVQAAAAALGLGFVPIEEERYDLVIPNHLIDEPGVKALLDLLRRPALRRRVEALGGYDVSGMGLPVPGA
jgi:molybdate-binding protein/DNA-binding XRE family transcriptional regulator